MLNAPRGQPLARSLHNSQALILFLRRLLKPRKSKMNEIFKSFLLLVRSIDLKNWILCIRWMHMMPIHGNFSSSLEIPHSSSSSPSSSSLSLELDALFPRLSPPRILKRIRLSAPNIPPLVAGEADDEDLVVL